MDTSAYDRFSSKEDDDNQGDFFPHDLPNAEELRIERGDNYFAGFYLQGLAWLEAHSNRIANMQLAGNPVVSGQIKLVESVGEWLENAADQLPEWFPLRTLMEID